MSEKWMVWYEDDTVKPVGVLAENRKTAGEVGAEARPKNDVVAVVGEDEGADVPENRKLSTPENPKQYLSMVYNESTDGKANSTHTTHEVNADSVKIESDIQASDLLDRDDLR